MCVIMSSQTTVVTQQSKTTTQINMHLENIECRLEVSKLSFKILLTEIYLLYMSTKRTGS